VPGIMAQSGHDVTLGSISTDRRFKRHVGSGPKSRDRGGLLKSTHRATSGLMHRSKEDRYSITSSAVARSVCGSTRPSALVVLRLTTSSNFVGS